VAAHGPWSASTREEIASLAASVVGEESPHFAVEKARRILQQAEHKAMAGD